MAYTQPPMYTSGIVLLFALLLRTVTSDDVLAAKPVNRCRALLKATYPIKPVVTRVLFSGRGNVNVTATEFKRKICALANVKNIRQLAKVLQRPYNVVRHIYQNMQIRIKKIGGVVGFKQIFKLAFSIRTKAKQAGYPKWPLKVAVSKAEMLLWKLVKTYGSDFPAKLMLYSVPTARVPATDVKKLARALTTSPSQNYLLRKMNYSKESAGRFFHGLTVMMKDKNWKLFKRYTRACIKAMAVGKKLGLLDLS